jgi:histidyl-tRNA synthetase
LSEGWQQHAPLKVTAHGPVFRYERPQKGRFRQFHQVDAEVIGTDSPLADVELLAFADQLLRDLGIADGVTLQLNTLGDQETRDAWRAALVSISRRIGKTSPRTASPASTRTRSASSTARIRAIARSPTARQGSTIT